MKLIRTHGELLDELRDALRKSRLPMTEVDAIAQWAAGYAGKVFGPEPSRLLSLDYTLWLALGTLGKALWIGDDPEPRPGLLKVLAAARRKKIRPTQRQREGGKWGLRKHLAAAGRKGAARWLEMTPSERRRRIARKAARARWRNVPAADRSEMAKTVANARWNGCSSHACSTAGHALSARRKRTGGK